jgi:hypothetical protein
MKAEEIRLHFQKLNEQKFGLGKYEDLLNDQNKLIQQAQGVLSDIIAMSNRLLPIAGKMSSNEKEALSLVQKAKEVGADDLATKYDSLGKNKISSSVIKASDNVISTAKSYKL